MNVVGVPGCQCGLLSISFQEQESQNRAKPALFSKPVQCYSALSVAVQLTLRAQLLSNHQILGLQGDTAHHLEQMTAALLTPWGTNEVGSNPNSAAALPYPEQLQPLPWHKLMSISTISSVSQVDFLGGAGVEDLSGQLEMGTINNGLFPTQKVQKRTWQGQWDSLM